MIATTTTIRSTRTTKKDYIRLHAMAREADRTKRLALLEIHDAELYRHAGYASWTDYVRAEWAHSERHSYRLLAAARVQADLTRASVGTDPSAASDRTLCELARVDAAGTRQEIWEEAAAGGDVTAAAVRDLVDEYLEEIEDDGDAHQLPAEDYVRESRGGQPAPRSGTDWGARIAKKVAAARHLHAKLGERAGAADEALDQYLAVVKGGER